MKRVTFSMVDKRSDDEPIGGSDRDSAMCAAPGCPMWGSISDQTVGEVRRRWCRFHIGTGGAHEPRITRALQSAIAAVREEQNARDALARGAVALDWRDTLRQAELTLQAAVRDHAA